MASPEHQALVDILRNQPVLDGATIQDKRAGMEAMAGGAPLPEGSVVQPVDAGGVPAEWVSVEGSSQDAVLLYLHGGGYCIGSLNTHRAMAARLAHASRARVLNVDYRLAPEHPHPAAVEDAVAAYRWLLGTGVEPGQVVVGGDSAGGGLVVAMLLALRDGGHPMPAAGFCLSPWVDLACGGGTYDTKADVDPMCTRDGLSEMAAAYAGDHDLRHPLVSPLHADLSGLPPLLIHVGTAEVLLDDAVVLAERARAAGVDVRLEAWDDLVHVFQAFAPMVPEAVEAIDGIGAFVQERLGSSITA
jgi:monoterpene epsilon-lactone hydrolase